MNCPHLSSHVSIDTRQKPLDIPNTSLCVDCGTAVESKWMCLTCGQIHCGRFVRGHAVTHYNSSEHPLALDMDSLACHCYICDEYVTEDDPRLDAIRESIKSSKQSPFQMKASSESAKKKKKHAVTGKKFEHLTGLSNLGNTCFMNVILQTLCHTQPIKHYFLSPDGPLSPTTSTPTSPRLGPMTRKAAFERRDVSIWDEFSNLLREMWTVQSVAISPDSFLNTIWKIVPMFRGYQQQDAQEFIRYLLDRINSELMVRRRMKKTVVFSIFQGILLNQVHCEGCEQTFVKRDAFLDLSLSIPDRFVNQRNKVLQSQNPCTLEDCLESFIETETLEDADMYDCSKCRGKRRATKKLTVDRLPPVLCLHLKRFKFTRHMRTKIDTYVEFPITDLDVRNYTIDASESQIYDLYSIIVHHGTSGSGHFLAYIWSPENSSWFEMNDSHARPTTPEVVHSQSAYMLFYLKRDMNPYFSDSDVSSTVSPDPVSPPHLKLQDPPSSSPRRSSNASLPSTPKSASYLEHCKNRLLRTQGDLSHVRRSLRRLSDQIETTDKPREVSERKRLRRSTSYIEDAEEDDEDEDASRPPTLASSLSEEVRQPSSPLRRPRGRPKRQIIIESD